ncbi:MAG: hypothetical protein BTN85_1346 [Candidatus Methanohalarchaeum thermophilum]|uniref:Uncharacterized protein n=1 Tax=Methanohalarchaeum thermophilum TaxID=1903181 RepID=A0A1Q6DWW1_METT1|nr:MAG: hypothetical protein BTN85_1346 [Candidatus Methanohalarchaeum thermophilum]
MLEKDKKKEKDFNLSKPSEEQAKKILSEVGYGDKIAGVRMHAMAGNTKEPLGSLREVDNFLKAKAPGKLIKGQTSSVNYIDPNALSSWIKEVLGDSELAKKIEKNIDKEDDYRKQAKTIRKLIEKRIKQSRELISEN